MTTPPTVPEGTKTPRTDAFYGTANGTILFDGPSATFARSLEEELARLRAAADKMAETITSIESWDDVEKMFKALSDYNAATGKGDK